MHKQKSTDCVIAIGRFLILTKRRQNIHNSVEFGEISIHLIAKIELNRDLNVAQKEL
jgi:hypothetical protein